MCPWAQDAGMPEFVDMVDHMMLGIVIMDSSHFMVDWLQRFKIRNLYKALIIQKKKKEKLYTDYKSFSCLLIQMKLKIFFFLRKKAFISLPAGSLLI